MRHPLISIVVGTLCLLTFVSGVSYGADIPAIRDAKDSGERARVQALIDGARKENKLEWRAIMIEPKQAENIIAGFKEYYGLSNLKCDYTYGSNMKSSAGWSNSSRPNVPPDVVWLIAWDWFTDLMKEGKLMRYDSPYYKEYTLSNNAGNSMSGYWVSDSYSNNPVWNVTELEKRGVKNFKPSGWKDFGDPKLGAVTSLSNIATSPTNAFWAIGLRKVLGDDWFINIAKGKPALSTRSEQGKKWIGSGEYPICLTMRAKNAKGLEDGGTKVGWINPKEGQVLFPFALAGLASAPNPNTAKLFIDYVRSVPGTNRMAESGIMITYGRPGLRRYRKRQKSSCFRQKK